MERKLPPGIKTYVGWEGAKKRKIKGAYLAYRTKQRGPNAPVVQVKRKKRERLIYDSSGQLINKVKILNNRYAFEKRIKPQIIKKRRFFKLE